MARASTRTSGRERSPPRLRGSMRAAKSDSLAWMFPTPARTDWSSSATFTALRVAPRRPSSSTGSMPSCTGSGPSAATSGSAAKSAPGTTRCLPNRRGSR